MAFVLELPPSCLSSVTVELGGVWAFVFGCVHSIQTLSYKLYQQSFKSCLLFAEGHVFDSYYECACVCMGGGIYAMAHVRRSEGRPLAFILAVI